MPPALLPLAATGGELSSFGPWVPAVDPQGKVAFTAVDREGRTVLCLVDERAPLGTWAAGGETEAGARPAARLRAPAAAAGGDPAEPVRAFTSHPDLDGRGVLYAYAAIEGGGHALVAAGPEGLRCVYASAPGRVGDGPSRPALASLGPTGPTVNRHGAVALRGVDPNGRAGCHLWVEGALSGLAEEPTWEGFDGLPLVNDAGQVALRTRRGGGDRLLCGRPGALEVRGGEFLELGRFPCLAEDGTVGVATRGARGWGYHAWRGGRPQALVPEGRFPFVRGGLLVSGGLLAVYVQTARSPLAVLVGPDPERDLLAGVGLPLFGSEVVDLALNPVSGDAVGWVAIRLTLADGRSLVCRTEAPVAPWRDG